MPVRCFSSQRTRREEGQSLIETALILPVFLLIVFYAVNFSYYLFVAVNLASAPREGVEYSIQGLSTPSTPSLPAAGPSSTPTSVSWLTLQDMAGLSGSSNAQVQVCSETIGVTSGVANCSQYPSGSTFSTAVQSDPEAPLFVLHRVDVQYTVQPLIPAGIFGVVNFMPSLTFHRYVVMRAMN